MTLGIIDQFSFEFLECPFAYAVRLATLADPVPGLYGRDVADQVEVRT